MVQTRMVDLPVTIKTRALIKKLKGDLTYDEFFQNKFGGQK